MQNYFKKQWIVLGCVIFLALIGIGIQKLLVKHLAVKVMACEQENQALSEKLHGKLNKANKQVVSLTDENRFIKNSNEALIKEIDELKLTEKDIKEQLDKIQAQKNLLENNVNAVKLDLEEKIVNLKQENKNLSTINTELKEQIKNHKINSYSLFQAGKLELELANLDQKLDEHYENITFKQNEMLTLKEKCGKLRTDIKSCKQYDLINSMVKLLQQQVEHLQTQREDLKQRIKVYLSSSNKTNH